MKTTHRWLLLPVGIAILSLAVIGALPASLPTADATVVPQSSIMRPVGGISQGVTVTQQFPASGSEIASIALFLATYQRVNHGTLHVTLLASANGDWKEVAARDVDETTLQDNAYATLTFSPPVPVRRGEPVRITLQSSGSAAEAITWWTSLTWDQPGYPLTVNDHPADGTGIFRVAYARQSGRLFQVAGGVWRRMTLLLNPFWRVVLLSGLCVMAVAPAIIVWGFRAGRGSAAARAKVDTRTEADILPVGNSGSEGQREMHGTE